MLYLWFFLANRCRGNDGWVKSVSLLGRKIIPSLVGLFDVTNHAPSDKGVNAAKRMNGASEVATMMDERISFATINENARPSVNRLTCG
jgi:hypothetical protein